MIDHKEILLFAQKIAPQVIDLRRTLHQYPEKGFNEHKTGEIIRDFLKKKDIASSQPIAETGFKALVCGDMQQSRNQPPPNGKNIQSQDDISGNMQNSMNKSETKFQNIGLRADMDGLSSPDRCGMEYASLNDGMNHA